MSTLAVEYDLASNRRFQARVQIALTRVAQEIFVEPQDTPGFLMRISMARGALNPGDLTSSGYAPAVAVDADVSAAAVVAAAMDGATPDTIAEAVSDELILSAVRAVWDRACGWAPAPVEVPA